MTSTQKREQATVLFTDIVGYTRLMNENELEALSKLRRFQQKLEGLVASYSGQIIQYYGDAALVLFKDPANAVNCGSK